MNIGIDKSKLLYLLGFWASFQSFSMQAFVPKISVFLFNDHQLTVLFSIVTIGFASGCVAFHFLKQKVFLLMSLLGFLMPSLYLFSFGWVVNPFLFYILSYLLWLPLGYFILFGLNQAEPHKFYFADLLGGCFGLVFATFSYRYLPIESSLILLSCFALLVMIPILKNQNLQRTFALVCLISMVLLAWNQKSQFFNLITWAKKIEYPKTQDHTGLRNGFQTLKHQDAELWGSQWSVSDRVDLIQTTEHGLLGYSNNKLWTGVPGENAKAKYTYLREFSHRSLDSFLSIGSGGGEALQSAQKLGFSKILGIEMSEALLELIRESSKQRGNLGFIVDHTIIDEAYTYLQKNSEQFDVVETKYTDVSVKSLKYFEDFNFIRTQESVALVIDHLSEAGVGIWVVQQYEDHVDPLLGSLVQAISDRVGKRWADHIVVGYEKDGRMHKLNDGDVPSNLHVLFSPTPWRTEEIKEASKQNFIFSRFLEYSLNDAATGLVRALRKANTAEDIKSSIIEQLGPSAVTTINQPLRKKGTIFLWINLGLLVLALLTLFVISGFEFYKETPRVSQQRTIWTLLSVGSLTGFSYGLAQACIVQELEYFYANVTTPFVLVLVCFLLGGALASVVSKKLPLNVSLLFYCILPAGLFSVCSAKAFGFMPPVVLVGVFFVFIFSISLLFPKLFETAKAIGPNRLDLYFLVNIVSIAIGIVAFYMLFIHFGRQDGQRIVLSVSVFLTLVVATFVSFLKKSRT